MESNVRWTLTVALAACFLAGVTLPRAASLEGAVLVNGPSYQLPAGAGRLVDLRSEAVPEAVRTFRAEFGENWCIYWDDSLGAPRFLRALEDLPLASVLEMGAPEELRRTVAIRLRLLIEPFELARVGLAEPFVYRADRSIVLVFQQTTPRGLPLRGANARVVLHADGRLAWIKLFLLPGCPGHAECAEEWAPPGGGTWPVEGQILRSRLAVGFPDAAPTGARPLWFLEVLQEPGVEGTVECVQDAATGETLCVRRVRKFFDVSGLVLGRSPAPEDIYAGPTSGVPVTASLREAVVRDASGNVLCSSGSDGTFRFPVERSPGRISASLERGEPFAGQEGETAFRSLLQVAPLGPMLLPADLGAEDADGDGVPEAMADAEDGGEMILSFNRDRSDERCAERAWWLQCFHHAGTMLERVRDRLAALRLDEELLPIKPLRIHPTVLPGVQSYARPNSAAGGFATLITSMTMHVGKSAAGDWLTEEVVPTRLLHEVGHHVVLHVTGYGEVELTGVEEGTADALVGFTTGRCEIGCRGPLRPTPIGFCLGGEGDSRDPGRADVGNAFWRLREEIVRGGGGDDLGEVDPAETAMGLLLQWLAWNRVGAEDQLVFDRSDLLLEELLEVDEYLYGPAGTVRKDRLHTGAILQAFRGRKFFDAPFVRGDSNLDGSIDLSDAVAILNFLFGGEGKVHDCRNSMDADDNASVNITDAVYLLGHLFLGGPEPPAPHPGCGLDPAPPGSAGNLGCLDFVCPR